MAMPGGGNGFADEEAMDDVMPMAAGAPRFGRRHIMYKGGGNRYIRRAAYSPMNRRPIPPPNAPET